jgi:hypothetical protein
LGRVHPKRNPSFAFAHFGLRVILPSQDFSKSFCFLSAIHKSSMAVEELFVVFGGELAADVAERVLSKKPPGSVVNVTLRNASDKPQKLVEHGENTCICFVIQTVENEAPAEDVSSFLVKSVLSDGDRESHLILPFFCTFYRPAFACASSKERHTPSLF